MRRRRRRACSAASIPCCRSPCCSPWWRPRTCTGHFDTHFSLAPALGWEREYSVHMNSAFAACEAMVRRADPDRYFSALFAPAETRPLLFALYAFNHELARIGEVVHQPMTGEIRLQ